MVASVAAAHAKPPEILPLSKVRAGQRGYGLTTFKGTKPERFSFEVIGVQRNFLPKMDVILVKSDDPKLRLSGFWSGMSGSPLFIQGKLVCAFSYGFRFNKAAIGGCTPIRYMKQQGFVKPRHLRRTTKRRGGRVLIRARRAASAQQWLRVAPRRTVASALEKLGPPRTPWLMRAPLPPAPSRVRLAKGDRGMVAAAVPLALSGFSAPAFAEAKQIMSRYPVIPMRTGGTGWSNRGPRNLEIGGPMAVQLIRGDMSAATFGTVSYVEKNKVLAFGHPMFQVGEIYAPVTAAKVHTVLPSAMSSFVIASPLREVGTLIQDRQATVMADTGLKTRMIPVSIEIRRRNGTNGKKRSRFNVEVLNDRFLTASLTGVAALNAMKVYFPDRDHATVRIDSEVRIRGGHEPLRFVDHLYSNRGAQRVIGGARGLRALVPLLNNPYQPVEIERVKLTATVSYDTNVGKLKQLKLRANELVPGKRNYVDVVMSRYGKKDVVERVPFQVPKRLAGSIVRIEVTAGDNAGYHGAPPTNFKQLLRAFRTLLPGNVIVVNVYSGSEGVAVNGKVVRDLPGSALDKLYPGVSTRTAGVLRPVAQSTVPSRRVIQGKLRVLVKVADAK